MMDPQTTPYGAGAGAGAGDAAAPAPAPAALQLVYGWASVIARNGVAVADGEGDTISAAELERAATRFMESGRAAGVMHEGRVIGQVVHSLPLTAEVATALGVVSPVMGWAIGVRVTDPAVWARVQSGELRAFSLGGSAERVESAGMTGGEG